MLLLPLYIWLLPFLHTNRDTRTHNHQYYQNHVGDCLRSIRPYPRHTKPIYIQHHIPRHTNRDLFRLPCAMRPAPPKQPPTTSICRTGHILVAVPSLFLCCYTQHTALTPPATPPPTLHFSFRQICCESEMAAFPYSASLRAMLRKTSHPYKAQDYKPTKAGSASVFEI